MVSFVDYYPNAERIVTVLDSMMITPREYKKLKEISVELRKYFQQTLGIETISCGFIRHYVEHVIIDSKNNGLKPLEKEIIIANIMLPDDMEVINLLNDNGFDIYTLKLLMRIRSQLKYIILN